MAVTSYKYPSAEGDIVSEWISPTNAYADDNSGAIGSAHTSFDRQNYLTFGFTSGDIPAGATIDGIELEAEVNAQGGDCTITFQLTMDVGSTTTAVGDTKAETWTAASWGNAKTVGGASDLWGRVWTQSEILDTQFGVDCTTSNVGTSYIDYIKIRVYYHTSTAHVLNVAETVVGVDTKATSTAKTLSDGIAGVDVKATDTGHNPDETIDLVQMLDADKYTSGGTPSGQGPGTEKNIGDLATPCDEKVMLGPNCTEKVV